MAVTAPIESTLELDGRWTHCEELRQHMATAVATDPLTAEIVVTAWLAVVARLAILLWSQRDADAIRGLAYVNNETQGNLARWENIAFADS